jgi:hypothetical protein
MQHAIIAKLHKRVLCVQDKHGQIERRGPITQIQRHPYSIAQPSEGAKGAAAYAAFAAFARDSAGERAVSWGKFERMDNLVTIHIRSMCVDGQHIGELWEAARPMVLGQHG